MLTLVGDGIERPANARALLDAAAMFGAAARFHDRGRLAAAWSADADTRPTASAAALCRDHDPILAFDDLPGALDIYGFRPPPGPRPALVVGNERRGIGPELRGAAAGAARIPLAAGRLNSLNVAAAAAVGLYYLSRGAGGPMQISAQPGRSRPELLLLGAGDHVELGSVLRSAGALGWSRVLVEDRAGVWFGAPRPLQAEGRAAARCHRNPIRVVPTRPDGRYAFAEVSVVTARGGDRPLQRTNLARGPEQLIVLADEGSLDPAAEDWSRLGRAVRHVSLDLPRSALPHRYRLTATIALAEIARQVGRPPTAARPPRGRAGRPARPGRASSGMGAHLRWSARAPGQARDQGRRPTGQPRPRPALATPPAVARPLLPRLGRRRPAGRRRALRAARRADR